MDADKWAAHYKRTKEKEGVQKAMKSLVAGMNREMYSRIERKKPWESESAIAEEVDEMYRQVANRFYELNPNGYQEITRELAPEVAQAVGW